MLEGDKSLFELKTKAQMDISNLNKAGSMAFKSDFTVFYPVLLLHTTLGRIIC